MTLKAEWNIHFQLHPEGEGPLIGQQGGRGWTPAGLKLWAEATVQAADRKVVGTEGVHPGLSAPSFGLVPSSSSGGGEPVSHAPTRSLSAPGLPLAVAGGVHDCSGRQGARPSLAPR